MRKNNMIRIIILLVCLNVFALHAVESLAVVYGNDLMQMKAEEIQRIKTSPVDYIAVQIILGKTSPEMIQRLKELTEKKKLLIQIWWGPGGRFNWSYYSLPALAYEEEVRTAFFREVDSIIDAISPKRIYGIHLLEESHYFGVDIDRSGDWKKNKTAVVDGYEDGMPYNNNTPPAWSPVRPNLARYKDIFQKETGVRMGMHSVWNPDQRQAFARFCERTAARAECEFFKHIKQKYPGIKTFTWFGLPLQGYTFSDFSLYQGLLDGVIANPYNAMQMILPAYRGFKKVKPDLILVSILYGNFVNRNIRAAKLANAWLGGADVVGFFEGVNAPCFGTERASDILKEAHPDGNNGSKREAMDWKSESIWKLNSELFAQLKNVPVCKAEAPFLVVSGNVDRNYQASGFHYHGLYLLDAFSAESVYLLDDIRPYTMVIAHQCPISDGSVFQEKYHVPSVGLDRKKILDYVKGGGILAVVHRELPDFLKDRITESPFSEKKLDYRGRNVKISTSSPQPVPGKECETFFGGVLLPYGKGWIWYSGTIDGSGNPKSELALNYERFLTDALYELLKKAGKEKIARQYVSPPDMECNHRLVSSNGYRVFYQFFPDRCKPVEMRFSGMDILHGDRNPVTGPERACVFIKGTDSN